MPPRTNDFQELVSLVIKALAPVGAKITPSAMITPAGLSTAREVDLLVEGRYGPATIKLAYEANSENKPLDLPKLESYVTKYRGPAPLSVDKFVLVTKHGYTTGAKELAERAGLELMTLKAAEEYDWANAFAKSPAMIRFSVAPHVCRMRIEPIDVPYSELKDAHYLCDKCGKPHRLAKCAVQKMAHLLRESPELQTIIEQQIVERGESRVEVAWEVGDWAIIREGAENVPFTKLHFLIHTVSDVAPVDCAIHELASNQQASQVVATFDACVGGKSLTWAVPPPRTPGALPLPTVLRVEDAEKSRPIGAEPPKTLPAASRERRIFFPTEVVGIKLSASSNLVPFGRARDGTWHPRMGRHQRWTLEIARALKRGEVGGFFGGPNGVVVTWEVVQRRQTAKGQPPSIGGA